MELAYRESTGSKSPASRIRFIRRALTAVFEPFDDCGPAAFLSREDADFFPSAREGFGEEPPPFDKMNAAIIPPRSNPRTMSANRDERVFMTKILRFKENADKPFQGKYIHFLPYCQVEMQNKL
jgi:hypothetical protein